MYVSHRDRSDTPADDPVVLLQEELQVIKQKYEDTLLSQKVCYLIIGFWNKFVVSDKVFLSQTVTSNNYISSCY